MAFCTAPSADPTDATGAAPLPGAAPPSAAGATGSGVTGRPAAACSAWTCFSRAASSAAFFASSSALRLFSSSSRRRFCSSSRLRFSSSLRFFSSSLASSVSSFLRFSVTMTAYLRLHSHIARHFSTMGFDLRLSSKMRSFSSKMGIMTSGSASCNSSRKAAAPILKNMRSMPRAYSERVMPTTSAITSQNSAGGKLPMLGGIMSLYREWTESYGIRVGYPPWMSLTASRVPDMRSWLMTCSPCISSGFRLGFDLMHRTKCASEELSSRMRALREEINFRPTDEKLPPFFFLLSAAGGSSGWQIVTTIGFEERRSSSSNSLVRVSLFFSMNSPLLYTTSPAKCFTTKYSSLERVSSAPFLDDSFGAPKALVFACVLCSCAQNVLPVALGVLQAPSSVA